MFRALDAPHHIERLVVEFYLFRISSDEACFTTRSSQFRGNGRPMLLYWAKCDTDHVTTASFGQANRRPSLPTSDIDHSMVRGNLSHVRERIGQLALHNKGGLMRFVTVL